MLPRIASNILYAIGSLITRINWQGWIYILIITALFIINQQGEL